MRRNAFTLIEMTIVIAIIAILAGMALSVYNTAAQQSKGMRTRAIIAKIDQLIGEKYESYRTRQVPIRIPPGTQPNVAAQIRLCAIRDLMRMEMPDHREDVIDGPAQLPGNLYLARPSLSKNYLRRGTASWTANPADWSNDSAECLYLILAAMRDGDKSALDYFSPSEIGDLDNDGLNEIHDSFGRPILFFRWAPGYLNTDVVTPQDAGQPDPYDPFKADPRWTNGGIQPYDLKPLIVSTGPDKLYDLYSQINFHYSQTSALPGSPCNSDPFCLVPDAGGTPRLFGTPLDTDGDGSISTDNITNHDLEAR